MGSDLITLLGVAASDPLTCALILATVILVAYVMLTRPRRALSNMPVRPMSFSSPDGLTKHRFMVEVVRKPKDQRVGMMFRTSIEPGTGMAFVWRKPTWSMMWMRQTFLSLDIVFVGRNGRVLEVVTRTPKGFGLSGWRFRSSMVVELPAGTCVSRGIGPAWIVTLLNS